MLCVAFIGKQNKTNAVIADMLASFFDAEINYMDPKQVFTSSSFPSFKNTEIIIVDLNTSSGLGNAPENIELLNEKAPGIPILVLDHYSYKNLMKPLIKAKASGIISTTPSEIELTHAVSTLLKGNTYYDFP